MKKARISGQITVSVNVFIILIAVFSLFAYQHYANEQTIRFNMNSIERSTKNMAEMITIYFDSHLLSVTDFGRYIEQSDATLDEILPSLSWFKMDEHVAVQLIDPETYSGVELSSAGVHAAVDYSDASYKKLHAIFDNQRNGKGEKSGISPEFTNYSNGIRSVAFYTSVPVRVPETQSHKMFIVFYVINLKHELESLINLYTFEYATAVLVNKDGDYILKQGEFRSNNIYSFLDAYNNPLSKEQAFYREQVLTTGTGSLLLNDSAGNLCVFSYSRVRNNNEWIYFARVPVSDFVSSSTDYVVAAILGAGLLLLALVNFLYLNRINKRLKESLVRTEIASKAKTDFLSRMSHDMRTPMNGIIGMCNLTIDRTDLTSEVRSNMEKIKESSAFLLSLINDTLDMNKIESNKLSFNPKPVRVGAFIEQLRSMLTITAEQRGIHFIVENPNTENNTYVLIDPLRVQQIFINIITNAIKFTPRDGSVTVTIEVTERTELKSSAKISVKDTGIGISREFLSKVFEPFEQEDSALSDVTPGSGLGLSIVKNLVTMMHGSVTLESEKGKGTTVTVHLPFDKAEPPENSAAEAVNVSDDVLNGKRVLLVEDHPLNAMIACKLLEAKQMIVVAVVNGKEAVDTFAASRKNEFDVILMDIKMPLMDGYAATKAIRALPREDAESIPIIAMTANAFDEDVAAAFAAGMNAHVAKPVDPKLLYRTIISFLVHPASAAQNRE